MNNAHVEKLIKEGKYKEVLKYLDGEAIKSNDEDVQLDESLMIKLNKLNEIPEDENSFLDKTKFEELNPNLNFRELIDDSILNKTINKQNEDSSFEDNISVNKEEEMNMDPFADYLLNKAERETEIKETGNKPVDLYDQLQDLLKKEESNHEKMEQIREGQMMSEEEKYGFILREQTRQKLFPNINVELKLNELLLTDSFKTEWDYHGVKIPKIENIISFNDKINIDYLNDVNHFKTFKDNYDINTNTIEIIEKKSLAKTIVNICKNDTNLGKIIEDYKLDTNLISKCTKSNNIQLFTFSELKYLKKLMYKGKEELKTNISTSNPIILNIKSKNSLEPSKPKITQDVKEIIKVWNKKYSFIIDSKIENINKNTSNNSNNFNEYNQLLFRCLSKTKNDNKSAAYTNYSEFCELIKSSNIKNSLSENINNVYELNFVCCKISKITSEFQFLTNLQNLNLEDNNISKIENLNKCIKLTNLNLSKNNISQIENIDQNLNLEKLFLNNNHIKKLENIKSYKLKILSLARNKISTIEDLDLEVPFIEELTLCENQIKVMPKGLSMPYLKYLDMNDNKLTYINLKLCPNLEKLFLRENKLKYFDSDTSLNFCTKLKELDISFNKIEFLSDTLDFLHNNKYLEVLNINNNPFSMNIKSFLDLNQKLKLIFPNLRTIDNETISKTNSNSGKCGVTTEGNLFNSYFNIHNNESSFLKYFNAVFHSYVLFDKFNFNSVERNQSYYNLINFFNESYSRTKTVHFKEINSLLQDKFIKLNNSSQYQFVRHCYSLKHKFYFVVNSFTVMKRLYKQKKLIKISKSVLIQSTFRAYVYHKKYKEKLKGLILEEDNFNDDLVDFFANKENQQLEVNIPIENKFYNLDFEVIKEEEDDNLNVKQSVELPKHDSIQIVPNDKPEIKLNEIKRIPTREQSQGIIEKRSKADHMFDKGDIYKHPNPKKFNINTNVNVFELPINILPVAGKAPNNKSKMDELLLPKLNLLKNNKLLTPQPNDNLAINKLSTPLPIIKTSESKGDNLSESVKSLKSIRSSKSNSQVMSSYTQSSENKVYYGRLLPAKVLEEVKAVEKECSNAIKKAKEEWQFTNKKAEELLSNKIKKTYRKKIDKILQII